MSTSSAPSRPPRPGRRPTSRLVVACLTVLGLALAVALPLGWLLGRPEQDLGAPVDAAPPPATPVTPSTTRTSDDPAPAVRTRAATPPSVRFDRPVRLVLRARGLDAAIVAVGVDQHGAMALPTDVDRVGWYRFGPAPGDAEGSAVLAGHVDDAEQGLGALSRLAGARPGDRVEVVLASGRRVGYVVTGRQQFPKQRLPLDRLFTREGKGHLVLITCGGRFDARARHYSDNLVVRAEPAP